MFVYGFLEQIRHHKKKWVRHGTSAYHHASPCVKTPQLHHQTCHGYIGSSAALTAPGPGQRANRRIAADGEAKAASTPRGDWSYLP